MSSISNSAPASFYQDTSHLRHMNDQQGLKAAARQFEGLFMQQIMEAMRSASDAMASEDSPFNSEHQKTFRSMMDKQMSQNLAGDTGMGLTEAIIRQMSSHINSDVKYDEVSDRMDSMRPPNMINKGVT